MQHPLFIAHNDIGRPKLEQALETVVAIDHPAIKVVQVGGGKPSAIKLHHRTQVGWNDWNDVHDHPLGLVIRQAEGLHHVETLNELDAFLAGGRFQLSLDLGAGFFQVDLAEKLFDGLGPHHGLEVILVFLHHIAVLLLIKKLFFDQRGIARLGDDVLREVKYLLQKAGRKIKNQPHAGGNALEIPDMGHRSGQLDGAHALAAHLGTGNFHSAAVANLALIADSFILAAVALPVLGGAKNALAKEAVALGL